MQWSVPAMQICTVNSATGRKKSLYRGFSFWHDYCKDTGMKLAITVWNGRIAPVFDAAERCLVLDTVTDNRREEPIPPDSMEAKADFLAGLGIDALICGAISREYEEAVVAKNIEIVSFIAGNLEQVIQAWNEKRLMETEFSMPGCGCPRRRCRRRGCHAKQNLNL